MILNHFGIQMESLILIGHIGYPIGVRFAIMTREKIYEIYV